MNKGIYGLPGGRGAPRPSPVPWYFKKYTGNFPAVPTTLPLGANFTTLGASPNTDATPVEVIPALAHDVHYLKIWFYGPQLSTASTNSLGSVLIDPSGGSNWQPLITQIPYGFCNTLWTNAQKLELPIWLRAGTSIAVTGRCEHNADIATHRVLMECFGNPSRPDMWWCGRATETLGANPATSQGTSFMPGTSGSFGDWVDVGRSNKRYGSVAACFQGPDSNALAVTYYMQCGVNSAKIPGSSESISSSATTENYATQMGGIGLIHCDYPAGTLFQVRGAGHAATVEAFNAAVIGVYD